MEQTSIVHFRTLNTHQDQDLKALSCVAWPDPVGGMGFRAFFVSGTPIDQFNAEPSETSARLSTVRQVNGGLLLAGTTEGVADEVVIALKDRELGLPVSPPETELFAGLSCILAERNGESMDQLVAWIKYHVEHFGLEAVLLLDREKPIDISAFQVEIEEKINGRGLKCFVHLSADIPIGAGGLPAARHPYNAADAPGKDKMSAWEEDRWAAPLGELLIYEICKWRFLARARAVANLDLSDLLKPETNPFDQVHESGAGVLNLVGQRIYPWRLRKNEVPGFGDHICRQFDNMRANRRWCLAPARLSPDQIWRLIRVTDATPTSSESAGFWRAMSLRHPDASVNEIVPKTSLIEDPALLRLSKDHWGAKPIRPPKSSKVAQPSSKTRTLVVTCMKNEGPFILEWIAYHRAIGVDDFLVYTNDCDDGTDELLDALMERGVLQRRDNLFHGTGIKPQHWALAASEEEPLLKQAGWVISMDVDEFINIHVGKGRLSDLFEAIGDANMISLTWRLFGNSNRHTFEDRFIIDQFDRCAPKLCRKPHQAWGFKTLFRNIGIYKKMGVHRPKGLKPDLWDQINWVNGSGKPMPQKLIRNGWRSSLESYGYDLVTLNHYAVRNAESFLVKRDRGRVNHVDRDQGLSYWFRMNNNWEIDTSISKKRDLLVAEYENLLSDPELRSLHDASVACHRKKIAELKERPDYASLFEALTGERMERLSRLHTHFGANVFLIGPEAIPDEIAFKDDTPHDFFFTVERDLHRG